MKSTYSPTYGTAEIQPDPLEPLAELLGLMVEHDPFAWTYTAQLGDTGYVTLTYNLDPCKLAVPVRDELLRTASKLINWSHD